MIKKIFMVSILSLYAATLTVSAETTDERIERMEKELKELKQQVNATADAVEAKGSSAMGRATVGGYGELHYNNLDTPSGDKKEIDFHRFILFVGYDFSDNIRFWSELELEHSLSGDGKPGEIELEQAYLEFDINDSTQAKGGLFLIPVGIINETHEPPTFYGVERNPVEKNIIPATWWEAGAALSGQIGATGLSYDVAVTSGLEVDPVTVNIRKGRQKVAEAKAENLAYTGRIKYTGMPGLEIAGTVQYQDDISQADNDGLDEAVLYSTHVALNKAGFGLRALYAAWDISGPAAETAGKDKQDGYYVEASYKFTPKVGIFARHNGWSNDSVKDKEQTDVGINWWPHKDVVIKADYQSQNADAGDADGFNLGIGYQF